MLLDLNYALIANSVEARRRHGPDFFARLAEEEYRGWLIDLIRRFRVALVTARPSSSQTQTLARIRAMTGWQPDEAYFNTSNERPPDAKQRALIEHIYPRHGRDASMVAIESNASPMVMYRRNGIRCFKAMEDARGQRLEVW